MISISFDQVIQHLISQENYLNTEICSVLKSGPVRFFPILGLNRNRNRLRGPRDSTKVEPDLSQPVHTGHFWPLNRL